MPCQLPADCLNEIFEYLDDKKTLHSLLLVNRLYCKISVRILWRNIWNIRYTIARKHQPRVMSTILSTLVACLPDESKELLFKLGIFISTPTLKPPLFNYPALCKVLSINEICQIIHSVLEKIPNTSLLDKKDRNCLIVNEIIKMFITQISSLKELIFYDKIYNIRPNDISFTCFSGEINDCLKDLSELHCSSNLPSEFFNQLSKICHNLRSLNIIMNYESSDDLENSKILNELKKLISLQNNLKNLELSASHGGDWTNIIPALTKHSNTLTKLHINSGYDDSLPISFIALFSTLQEIKFSYTTRTFGEKQFKDFNKLEYANFPKLQYLSIPYNCARPEYIIKFLENNGKNLKNFYIEEVDRALNLSIAKFCPNLKKLSLVFNNDELDTLRIILNSCHYLESIKTRCGEKFLNEKEVLETVAKYSPKNFCELKICYYSNSELLPEDLESFFINWKNRASKTLFTLIIFKKHINKYINLKVSLRNLKLKLEI
ncbi:hypothetical protein C1645_860274 [Glomus cerebriforme]|uniref:F-box domain-containing protein n=1 Tax=Glomus cerebriforme TaxID=658196 RepID=A0A397S1W7_9GLOM|nr:hypothetical protein C1645_866859 [Glomus cerebriforme]RIA83784.1 hypothetical protein C1645_860274 [Glomus cerebriforme]